MLIQEYWSAFKKETWKIVLYTIAGNFFPIYIGWIVLPYLNADFHFLDIISTTSLTIYSATFIIASIFLWHKNAQKKTPVSLLLFIIVCICISILYAASFLKKIEHQNIHSIQTVILFTLSILIYIYQQTKDSVVNSTNYQAKRQESYNEFSKKFKN